jgi:hypothetical protein
VAVLQRQFISITISLAVIFTLMAGAAFAQTKDKDAAPTPYQARVIVTPLGTGFQSALLDIPAGKRFVIKNVSVITRSPEGMRMEVNFYSYIDRNGDNVGDIADITFNRIVLVDQGVFDGVQLATANHEVLVFADEVIGTTHYKVVAQARLNGMPPANAFTQAQFTFSGYLEDVPAPQ